jgi:hypothetical protein
MEVNGVNPGMELFPLPSYPSHLTTATCNLMSLRQFEKERKTWPLTPKQICKSLFENSSSL